MRKFFTLFLVLTASVGTLFAESGTCGDNLTWDLTDGILTINGTGVMEGWGIFKAPWYSYQSSIKAVVIKDGVTSIGDGAFFCCTELTNITIPNSVTNIGAYTFTSCKGLVSITIPNSVTSIGSVAFSGCSGLASITIPNSVTSIGVRAFLGCSGLTSMEVENGNTTYDSRNNCNAIIETASNTLIAGCQNTIIPNSVTSLGDDAFGECSGLTSIEIPNSVTSIGEAAFYNCSGLTYLTIPNRVTSLGKGAFSNCTGLKSIEIPNSVTSIGDDAFYGCTGLISVTNHATTPQVIEPYVFGNINLFTCTLYVPKESVAAYAAADVWKDFSNIIGINSDNTAVDMISERHSARKIIRNGSLYIQSVNNEYTVSGQQIK